MGYFGIMFDNRLPFEKHPCKKTLLGGWNITLTAVIWQNPLSPL